MTEQEWLDKQNGTTFALDGPQMSDTDRNIMRSLAHEACEAHCDECGACIHGYDEGLLGEDVCKDCYEDAYEAHQDAKAEEADEPCVVCGEMLRPGRHGQFEFSLDRDGEEPVCEDCYDDAREAHEDAKAEAQREGHLDRQEAAFNARWPR